MMNERISALMDGELSPEEATAVMEWIKHNPDAAEVWSSYHVIGEAMHRHDYLASNIRARVASRLAEEPTVLAPVNRKPKAVKRTWIALSAAASFAAVAMVGMLSYQHNQMQASQSVVVAKKSDSMDLNPYLAAHQQYAAQAGGRPQVRPVSMENPEGLSK